MRQTGDWIELFLILKCSGFPKVVEEASSTAPDATNRDDAALFDTLSDGISSLYVGLLFKAPATEIKRRLALLGRHREVATGTIFHPFYKIIMATAILITRDFSRLKEVNEADVWLAAFPKSTFQMQVLIDKIQPTLCSFIDRDFLAISHFLMALRAMGESLHPANQLDRWLGKAEHALELLADAELHLFTGKCPVRIPVYNSCLCLPRFWALTLHRSTLHAS